MNSDDILRLQEKYAGLLKEVRDRPAEIEGIVQMYLDEAYRLGLVADEVTDYFCVSTPNVIEMADCDVDEGDEIVNLFDHFHDELLRAS